MSDVLRKFAENPSDPTGPDFIFFCPGCRCGHAVWVNRKASNGAIWTFNGDEDKPTFKPSLLVDSTRGRCHSYVTDGQIQFLDDCTHDLKGQTVPLEKF